MSCHPLHTLDAADGLVESDGGGVADCLEVEKNDAGEAQCPREGPDHPDNNPAPNANDCIVTTPLKCNDENRVVVGTRSNDPVSAAAAADNKLLIVDLKESDLSDTTSVSEDTPPSSPHSADFADGGRLSRGGLRRRKSALQDSRITSSSSPARDEPSKRHKRNMILKALNVSPPDVATLRQLAISRGGLLDDSLRKRAWPCLLDVNVDTIPMKPDVETLHGHRDYEQVVLDVQRSMKRFPPGMLEEVRLGYQDQLVDCIMWVLVSHTELHYYQGFHDIVVTFLLVVGENLTFAIMDKLCQNHLRDFMEVTMEKTNYVLHYLLPLIGRASPTLRKFLEQSEVGTMFCLSWLITWYGHVLGDFQHIVRLYDFFMACHPLMPIYLAADIVLYRESDVLKCICEMPYVHSLLSRIPDDLPFELLITRAGDLFIQYPPNVLEEEAQQQYDRFVQEIQNRRNDGAARRTAAASNRGGARRRHSAPIGTATTHSPNVLMRLTVWGVVFAVSAVAFTYLRASTRFDWQSWWLWT